MRGFCLSPGFADTRDTDMIVFDEHTLRELIESKQYKVLREKLMASPPADIADLLINEPLENALIAFRLLPKDLAVDVFDRLDGTQQNRMLESFSDLTSRQFLEAMPADDRVELLDEVPAKVASKLLESLSHDQRQVTLKLLGYEEDTAGREMNPSYVDLHSDMTVSQALERVRKRAIHSETIYVCYVIDRQRRLLGTVSLKDLVLAEPEATVEAIMTPNPIFVFTATDREETAEKLQENDLLAIPVVDREQRLVGIITYDDVADIVEEETTEDVYRFGAVAGTERSYFTSRIFNVIKSRVGWLFLLILVNIVTGTIIARQEALLAEIVILSAFIPLLIGTGGNVGAQSATVIIRGLATGEVNPGKAAKIIVREAGIGAILGIILGVVVCAGAYLLGRDLGVAAVVSISLVGISILATLVGGALPFVFRLFKLDPALVSAPFITTVIDISGVGLYFFLAHMILQI
jgi:magnesium transporter